MVCPSTCEGQSRFMQLPTPVGSLILLAFPSLWVPSGKEKPSNLFFFLQVQHTCKLFVCALVILSVWDLKFPALSSAALFHTS